MSYGGEEIMPRGARRWPENYVKGGMKVITINVPTKYIRVIQKLLDAGLYPSRSEAVRVAIRDFISKDKELYLKYTEPIIETDDINVIRVPNGDGTYNKLYRVGEA